MGSMFLRSFLTLDRRARFCLNKASRSPVVVVGSLRLFIAAMGRDAAARERDRKGGLGGCGAAAAAAAAAAVLLSCTSMCARSTYLNSRF